MVPKNDIVQFLYDYPFMNCLEQFISDAISSIYISLNGIFSLEKALLK